MSTFTKLYHVLLLHKKKFDGSIFNSLRFSHLQSGKKLGIDEHETNLGIYVRKLMKSL